MSTVVYCDRCGKKLGNTGEYRAHVEISSREPVAMIQPPRPDAIDVDLCNGCRAALVRFFERLPQEGK